MEGKQKKRLLWQLPFLTLLVIGSILIIRHQQKMPYQKSADFIFGTSYSVIYQCDSDLSQSIKNELMKVDRSLSPFNEHSVITAVNNNKEVVLDDMFQEVFRKAMDISRETDGAFDITVAPLVNAWGFGFKNGSQPDRRQVDSLREIIGYEKLSLVNGKVQKKDPRMMLDCSAIAKGYGTDMVARLLKERGVQNYMVEIGGEIVTKGILNVTDKAMATSGNYRRFYYKGGKRFAHTIDPKTGYPVQHSILSATVLANDCATADAYATSFMVMGMEGTKRVLERHPELMAYLIYDDGHGNNAVWFSPSLRDKIAN